MASPTPCKICGYNQDGSSHSETPPITELYLPGVLRFLNSNDALAGIAKTEFELALVKEADNLS